jgi:prevent-host-death family protein
MTKLPDIIPISDLRQDAAKILQKVHSSKEPLVITQRGRAAAVMLSVESFERSQREREILYLLAKGEREIAADAGHDLEEVLAQVDAILASEPK